jgi:hypothetical protein
MWWLQPVITLITSIIVVFISYKLGQRKERFVQTRASEQENADLRLYAEIVENTKDGKTFHPPIESDLFKAALRLESRGLLERLPDNSFRLPGAKILMRL